MHAIQSGYSFPIVHEPKTFILDDTDDPTNLSSITQLESQIL